MDVDRNDWISTFTGRKFYPFHPMRDLDAICIRDIAHALSMTCRYGGHCRRFYSVAEHSVILARYVLAGRTMLPSSGRRAAQLDEALWALLHDASEAYVSDIVRPAKRGLPEYKRMEAGIMAAIADRFKLTDVMPEVVTIMDNRIVIDERQQNMRDTIAEWKETEGLMPLGVTLEFWHPDTAENKFLATYYNILEEMHR